MIRRLSEGGISWSCEHSLHTHHALLLWLQFRMWTLPDFLWITAYSDVSAHTTLGCLCVHLASPDHRHLKEIHGEECCFIQAMTERWNCVQWSVWWCTDHWYWQAYRWSPSVLLLKNKNHLHQRRKTFGWARGVWRYIYPVTTDKRPAFCIMLYWLSSCAANHTFYSNVFPSFGLPGTQVNRDIWDAVAAVVRTSRTCY